MATIYNVWGWNTAEENLYFVEKFFSYNEALKRVRELEAEAARTQPKNLRNTFAIQIFTEEEQHKLKPCSRVAPTSEDIVEESFPTKINKRLTAAKYCRFCGYKNPANARYCIVDGSTL